MEVFDHQDERLLRGDALEERSPRREGLLLPDRLIGVGGPHERGQPRVEP